MADHAKVVIYIPAQDARTLRAEGKDPKLWVREIISRELSKLHGSTESCAR